MPLVKIRERHQVVIPKEIFEKLRLRQGEYLNVQIKDRNIVMNPVKVAPREHKVSREEIHENIKKVWLKKKWARKDDPNLDEKIAKTVEAVIKARQEWFWTNEWQEKEREADKDIKKGRVETFTNAEGLIRDLNS